MDQIQIVSDKPLSPHKARRKLSSFINKQQQIQHQQQQQQQQDKEGEALVYVYDVTRSKIPDPILFQLQMVERALHIDVWL